jgi:hypothetical protein
VYKKVNKEVDTGDLEYKGVSSISIGKFETFANGKPRIDLRSEPKVDSDEEKPLTRKSKSRPKMGIRMADKKNSSSKIARKITSTDLGEISEEDEEGKVDLKISF